VVQKDLGRSPEKNCRREPNLKKETVEISVIVPVYNAAKYLGKCLDSIISQSYCQWKAYIIDDASTDNSNSLLYQYAERDKRIKIFRNETNQGPGNSRNRAIEYVLSDNRVTSGNSMKNYIVFIDSDDWIENNYFQSIVDVSYKNNADVVFVDVVQEDETGKFIRHDRMSSYSDQSKDIIIRHQMTCKLPWGGVRKAVKADLLNNNQIRFSSDLNGEEALYSFELVHSAHSIAFINKPLYHYVIHSDSQSNRFNDNPYGPICIKLEKYLKRNGLYSKYRNSLVSFAFTALIVSIFRKVKYYGFISSYKMSKLAVKEYREEYNFDLDKDCLELRVRILLPLVRFNIILPIIIAAKIKSFIERFLLEVKDS
jgi:glycosyltransferase involved in cell wall biosynthesis